MSSSSPKSRRRRRFTAEEARAALLQAGVELLDERGVANGLGRVKLGDAVLRSGVPRPSAYRLYAEGEFDPQDEFRTELLLHLLDLSGPGGPSTQGLAQSDRAQAEMQAMVDGGDPVELAYALREGMRQGTNLIWRSTTTRGAAAMATVLSLVMDPDPYQPVLDAYRTRRAATVSSYRTFYQERLDTFGLRIRQGYDIDDFASLVALSFDQVWDGSLAYGPDPSFQRPTGLHGELRAWTPFGMAVEGLILLMVEPDPEAAASARLTSWLE